MAEPKVVTARDLLHAFLELQYRVPNIDRWSSEEHTSNPPIQYRLRQLEAMFKAFEFSWNPASFLEGEFVKPGPRYEELLERVRSALPVELRRNFGRHGWSHCFGTLLEYRQRVEQVLRFSSGFLEVNAPLVYVLHTLGKLNTIIRNSLPIIDDVLVAFISPEGKSVTVEQLVREHGYPDVDLFEIDADYF